MDDSGLFQDPFVFDNDMDTAFLSDDFSNSQVLSSPSTEGIFESPLPSPARDENFQGSENNWLDQTMGSGNPVQYPMDTKEATEEFVPTQFASATSVSPLLVPGNPYLAVPSALPLQPLPPTYSTAEYSASSPEPNLSSEDDSEEDKKSKRPQKKRKLTETASVGTKAKGSKKAKAKEREKEKEIVLEFNEDRPLGLSRDELLTYTSSQFESYVRTLTSKRDLTQHEKSELKRQRRLIKNRESAQASRQRKKCNMEQLETKVQELEMEKQALKEQVAALASKNTQLENELMYYRKNASSSYFTDIVSRGLNLANLGKPTLIGPTPTPGIPAASLVVMVVLFSFGLLFPTFLGKAALPSTMRETIPVVNPQHARIFTTEGEFKQVSQDKDLADIIAEQELPLRRLAKLKEPSVARVEEVPADTNDSMVIDDDITEAVPTTVPTPRIPEKVVFGADFMKAQKITMPVTSPEILPSQVTVSNLPQMLHFKPNTTYLLCQNVSQILPPTSPGVQNSNGETIMTQEEMNALPPQIAFIIPPDSFGVPSVKGAGAGAPNSDKSSTAAASERTGSMWNYSDVPSPYFILDLHASPHSPSSEKPAFLEVTCSVVDMNFVPFSQNQPAAGGRGH